MAEVRFQQVSKVYPGGVHAVRDLSLDIADGELLVLVGPSGCGKSTLLRLAAGLERLTAGTIRIGDRVVNDVAPKDRDIAMVFQNYALYPHMTVYKNLAFGLRMRKTPKTEIDRRVRDVAAQLGLAELLGRRPGSLSGGQQQRVAVGRAIVREPRCFLFDEPLSNLDAALRVQMRAELKTLVQRLGTTTIFVTHDQEEAMTLGDRVVVLEAGVIQQVGRPLDVYRRPANTFVARFVGSPPMNLLNGRLTRRDAGTYFENDAGLSLLVSTNGTLPARDEVVMGIRPEAMRPGGAGLELTVDLCEIVGDRMDVHGRTGETPIVARIPATDECRSGDRITMTVDPGDVHLFEAGGGGGLRLTVDG